MGTMDIFWIFLMLIALQPVLAQKMLENARRRLMMKIEAMRGSRLILLIHRQETMSFLGFPLFKYINIHDSEEVLRAIHMTDDDMPIDIVLHTPGGLVLAALQIARALKRHRGKTTVFVPHYAMSGGTLIALAADEIVMSPDAVLGPIDPQIGEYPAASILSVVKKKKINEVDDSTLILADIGKKAIKQVEKAAYELLKGKMDDKKAKKIAKLLSTGKWTHDHPITLDEAKELGLNVSTDMPKEIYQLMTLYPQPTRGSQSVEYIPVKKTMNHK
ncbi:hypothetical protein DRQ17_05250 [bacterium]|nr:MAG: hypothetical protein DRQ17_05250 [bacterium]RKZ23074.1 MAG: hypothetical protein DRQ23_03785 [bacterium]